MLGMPAKLLAATVRNDVSCGYGVDRRADPPLRGLTLSAADVRDSQLLPPLLDPVIAVGSVAAAVSPPRRQPLRSSSDAPRGQITAMII